MWNMNQQRPLSNTPLMFFVLLLLFLSPAHTENCRIGNELDSSLYQSMYENAPLGSPVLTFPLVNTKRLYFEPYEQEEGHWEFFSLKFINETTGAIVVAKNLSDLLMKEVPVSVVDFQVTCATNSPNSMPYSLPVRIHIRDINNHRPRFLRVPYIVSVSELTEPGSIVFSDIEARDHDKPNTPNSDIYMWIAEGNNDGNFDLIQAEQKALLVLKKPLDFERGVRKFELIVMASDRGSPQQQSRTLLEVNVLDGDDQPPRFTAAIYKLNVTEFPGTNMKLVRENLITEPPIDAFDGDMNIGQMIIYKLIESKYSQHFVLNRNTGVVTLVKPFDREAMESDQFSLYIEARQSNNMDRTARAEIKVQVMDLNDNKPQFLASHHAEHIVENVPAGVKLFQVEAKDADQGANAEFKFILSGEDEALEAFDIDPNTGWISVKQQRLLDREKKEFFLFQVHAIEQTTNVISGNTSSSVNVSIHLLDSNDNSPVFLPDGHYRFEVIGNNSVGTTIGKVYAEDSDIGINGLVRYSLDSNNHRQVSDSFSVDSVSGRIQQELPLRNDIYVLFVRAADSPDYPDLMRSSLATVTVNVTGQTEPYLSILADQVFRVSTGSQSESSLGHIAINSSNYNQLSFRLVNQSVPFRIEEQSGEIIVSSSLVSSLSTTRYPLLVHVSNNDLATTGFITVLINASDDEDVNDDDGDEIDVLPSAQKNSAESMLLTVETDENISNVTLVNLLEFRTIDNAEWNILDGKMSQHFQITKSGDLILSAPLDFEETQQVNLSIMASDTMDERTRFVIYVVVNVVDVNDNTPVFGRTIYRGEIALNASIGSTLQLNPPITVTDRDDTGSLVDFQLINCSDLFSINKSAILTKKSANLNMNQLYCILQVFDEIGQASNTTLIIKVFKPENIEAESFHQLTEKAKGKKWVDTQLISEILDDKSFPILKRMVTNNEFYSDSLQSKSQTEYVVPYVEIPEKFPKGETVLKLISYHNMMECQISELLRHNGIVRINQPEKQYFDLNSTNNAVVMSRSNTTPNTVTLQLSWLRNGQRVIAKVIVNILPIPKILMSKSELDISLIKGQYYNHRMAQLQPSNLKDNETVAYRVIDDKDNSLSISEEGQVKFSGIIDERSTPIYFTVQVCPGLCVELVKGLLRTPKEAFTACSENCAQVDLSLYETKTNLTSSEEVIRPEFLYISDEVLGPTDDTIVSNQKQFQITYPYAIYKLVVPSQVTAGSKLVKVVAVKAGLEQTQLQYRLKPAAGDVNTSDALHMDPTSGLITARDDLTMQPGHPVRAVVESFDPTQPEAMSNAVVEFITLENDSIINNSKSSSEDGQDELIAIRFRLFRRSEYNVTLVEGYGQKEYQAEVPWRDELLSLQTIWSVQQIKTESNEPDIRVNINENHTMSIGTEYDLEKDLEAIFLVTARQKRRSHRLERAAEHAINSFLNNTMFDQAVLGEKPLEKFLRYYQTILRVRIARNRPPLFEDEKSPVLVGIPYDAEPGYTVTSIQARDEHDAESLRYVLKMNTSKLPDLYQINDRTGQIRLRKAMPKMIDKIHYMRVEAADQHDQKAVISIWAFVVEAENMAKVRMNASPAELKNRLDTIEQNLSNMTSYDVRVMDMTSFSGSSQDESPANKTDLRVYAFDPVDRKLIDGKTLSRKLRETNNEGTSGDLVLSGSWPVTAKTSTASLNLDHLAIFFVAVILIILVVVVIIICCKFSSRNKTTPKNGLTSSNSVFGSSTLSPPNSSSDMMFVGNTAKTGTSPSARHGQLAGRQLDHVAGEPASNNNYTAFPSMSRKLKTNRVSPNHYIADTTSTLRSDQNRENTPPADASTMVTFNSVYSPSVHYNRSQTLQPHAQTQAATNKNHPLHIATINRNNRNIFQRPLPPNCITAPPFDDQAKLDDMKMSTIDGADSTRVQNHPLSANSVFVRDFSHHNPAFSDTSSTDHKQSDQSAQIEEATMTFSSESPTFPDRPLMQTEPLINSRTAF